MINKYYHTIMYRIKGRLWNWWHSDLRWFFGVEYIGKNRPWYHLCCNGDCGGWRTRLCDMLEDYDTGWRHHEEKMKSGNDNG